MGGRGGLAVEMWRFHSPTRLKKGQRIESGQLGVILSSLDESERGFTVCLTLHSHCCWVGQIVLLQAAEMFWLEK